MKILAVIGSPKGKGSGYEIARRIESQMKKQGEVEFDYLFLRDQNLKLCKGCFVCVTRGENLCPLKDDRTAIEGRIDAADGIVMASPCYVSNVSWLMKNFIDRMCYTNHRPRFFHQKMLLVSNAGSGMEKTLETMRLALGAGPEIVGELSFLSPPWPLSEKVQAKQRRLIARQAQRLYDAIEKDAPRNGLPAAPSFSDYLRFRFFKKISVDVKDYLKADYHYYKDMQDYYFPAQVSLLKRIAAGTMLKLSMVLMKDMAPAEQG